MANSVGGWIVYGIEERNGFAEKLTPIPQGQVNLDGLFNYLRDTVQPPLLHPMIQPHEVDLYDERGTNIIGMALVIRILAADNVLFMVKERGYYLRHERAAVPMTERQVRERYELIWRRTSRHQERLSQVVDSEISSIPGDCWFGVLAIPDGLNPYAVDFETFKMHDAIQLHPDALAPKLIDEWWSQSNLVRYTGRGLEYRSLNFDFPQLNGDLRLLRITPQGIVHLGHSLIAGANPEDFASGEHAIEPPGPKDRWERLFLGLWATCIAESTIRVTQSLWRHIGLRESGTLIIAIRTPCALRLKEGWSALPSYMEAGIHTESVPITINNLFDDDVAPRQLTRVLMGRVLRHFGSAMCPWISADNNFDYQLLSFSAHWRR